MPFFTGISELAVATAERGFSRQEYSQLHGLLNGCRYPDEPLQIVFRALRIMIIAGGVLGFGDDIEPEHRNCVMVFLQQIRKGKSRCLKIPSRLTFRPPRCGCLPVLDSRSFAFLDDHILFTDQRLTQTRNLNLERMGDGDNIVPVYPPGQ